ncbi:MAG: cysteine--tRNA ligase [Motilibacteraceae bacterium]
MSLRLYDTAARSVRAFVPVRTGHVGVYVCGLTVQSEPHVGHVRSALSFDVLRRWLLRSGYEVTFVRNVTDIDDKILAKSAEAGRPWWAHAYLMERELTAAYDALGCLPPTYEPRATGHVPEMVELMQELIDRGHAYPAEDGSGDVYFDVRSWAQYGELSHQRVEDMEPAADADPRGKRDPHDFALWKGHKPTEPESASWPTPWGRGRPGWHLECSAMASKYLGEHFDIHGGGIDLRFPHHENEIAQSKAAGEQFAEYWLHNAWVTTSGEKMSKSLGNSLLVPAVLQRVRGVELRYYLVASHYRSNIEFSFEALDEAAATYQRIEGFVRRAVEVLGEGGALGTLPDGFVAAMDDDLNVSAALAVVQENVREGNKLLSDGPSERLAEVLASVRSMLDVLGVDPLAATWESAGGAEEPLRKAVDGLVRLALEQRQAARERKDWATADAVRDTLTASGVVVEDTPTGPRWSLEGRS